MGDVLGVTKYTFGGCDGYASGKSTRTWKAPPSYSSPPPSGQSTTRCQHPRSSSERSSSTSLCSRWDDSAAARSWHTRARDRASPDTPAFAANAAVEPDRCLARAVSCASRRPGTREPEDAAEEAEDATPTYSAAPTCLLSDSANPPGPTFMAAASSSEWMARRRARARPRQAAEAERARSAAARDASPRASRVSAAPSGARGGGGGTEWRWSPERMPMESIVSL